MITEFGKYIRKLRIDHAITLRQMADAIELSPSFLSSVETGKRNITPSYFDNVVRYFQLNDQDTAELRNLADISKNEISLSIKEATFEQKNSAIAFARRLNSLTTDDLKKINDILKD